MIDKKNLMNILIEYIQDVISFNDNKIDKSYIYKMIINPNYSTDNKLEEISEDNKIKI